MSLQPSRSQTLGLSEDQVRNLFFQVATLLDDAQGHEPESMFTGLAIWRLGREWMQSILTRLSSGEREAFLRQLFSQCRSIGWLVTEVIGHELFSHGRVGDSPDAQDSWLLTEDELDVGIQVILVRLRAEEHNEIADLPSLLSFLYRWKQMGGGRDVDIWVKQQTRDTARFLKVLSGMRGWASSDKVYRPLRKRDIEAFMDYEETMAHIRSLARDNLLSPELRLIAENVLASANFSDRFS